MKVTILHDEHGQIISISKFGDLKEAGSKVDDVGVVPGPGQHILEIELNGELEKKQLLELHKEYHVDHASSRLVKKH